MVSSNIRIQNNLLNTGLLKYSSPSLSNGDYQSVVSYIYRLYRAGNSLNIVTQPNSVRSLGWSFDETLETYLRLRHFEKDWDAPGMDAYDKL